MKITANNYFLLILTVFVFSACVNEDFLEYEENIDVRNVGDYINNNFDLSLFYAALEKTGVMDEITGEDVVTVFAPNNTAFNAVGVYRPADFDLLDQDSLAYMLRYHILQRPLIRGDVAIQAIDAEYPNSADKKLIISKENSLNGALYINGVKTVYSDIMLANGVLHIMDACLKYREGTVQDILSGRNELSIFVAALKKFGYWDRLAEAGPWTITAPSNSAFETAGISLEDIGDMNPDNFRKRFLGAYIMNTRLFISDLGIIFGFRDMYPRYGQENIMLIIEGDEAVSSGLLLKSAGSYPLWFYQGNLFLTVTYGQLTDGLKMIPVSSANRINYLSDNGVVHTTDQLLVLPEEALIEETN